MKEMLYQLIEKKREVIFELQKEMGLLLTCYDSIKSSSETKNIQKDASIDRHE